MHALSPLIVLSILVIVIILIIHFSNPPRSTRSRQRTTPQIANAIAGAQSSVVQQPAASPNTNINAGMLGAQMNGAVQPQQGDMFGQAGAFTQGAIFDPSRTVGPNNQADPQPPAIRSDDLMLDAMMRNEPPIAQSQLAMQVNNRTRIVTPSIIATDVTNYAGNVLALTPAELILLQPISPPAHNILQRYPNSIGATRIETVGSRLVALRGGELFTALNPAGPWERVISAGNVEFMMSTVDDHLWIQGNERGQLLNAQLQPVRQGKLTPNVYYSFRTSRSSPMRFSTPLVIAWDPRQEDLITVNNSHVLRVKMINGAIYYIVVK